MNSTKNQYGNSDPALLIIGVYLAIVIFCGLGWIQNAYKLTQCDFDAPYKAEIIRTIGVFVPPVGFVGGWFDIQDGE